jgi:tetratricopeptide (TPR) repeat protein
MRASLALVLTATWLAPLTALGADDPAAAVAAAVTSLEKGNYDDAIDRLEALADQGFAHPDASYDRAAAYVARARSPNARPGDLGRAAAALEETLRLRPGDADAEHALERVRGEIARRRARAGADPVVAKTTLSRAVLELLDESVWAALAALGSLALTAGLAVLSLTQAHRARVAGSTAAAIGGVLLSCCGAAAAGARHFRLSSTPAVVVAPEARLLDENGRPVVQKNGEPEHVVMAEGTSVYVRERRGTLARIEWGSTEAWVDASQLRVLATR